MNSRLSSAGQPDDLGGDMSSLVCIKRRQRATVIAFDSWTGGIENIQRLVDAFARRGLELMLIHIGSWGHDLGRAEEERIGDLLVRDIGYYKNLSFKEILLRERPVAVLFLSTQAFAHRAFNRYCRQLRIPTLHLYHGIVKVQNTSSRRLNPINARSQFALAGSRLAKNVFRLWPLYGTALWNTRASLSDWAWFAYDVWRQILGRSYSGDAAPDASTAGCCVYAEVDATHAQQRYRLPADAVFAVGNPDLLKFGLSADDIGSCLTACQRAAGDIIYIDAALIEAGAVFDDARDYVRHLQQTALILAQQGLHLVVKLHPAHSRTGVAQQLNERGVELCDNNAFVKRLKACSGSIVEPSSAALIPALLGLPLLLARYSKLTGQEYGDVLTNYPKARVLHSLGDVNKLLVDASRVDNDATRAWINTNAGPIPVEQMPDRVARAVETIVRQNTTKSVSGTA